jgi:hypothetical protein
MSQIEKVLYTAKTHTTGGRDGGAAMVTMAESAKAYLRMRAVAAVRAAEKELSLAAS